MSLAEYLKFRHARSLLKAGIRQASAIRNMQRDEAGAVNDAALRGAIASAREVWRHARTSREQEEALETLSAAVGPGTAWKPLHPNALAENFEVLVVAVAVAMAFRCYFLEPFKIPTGSMQPTLYGIYSTDQEAPGFWDRHPFKVFKWLVTGDWYREVRVSDGGPVVRITVKPGYNSFQVGKRRYHVPSDAVQERNLPFDANINYIVANINCIVTNSTIISRVTKLEETSNVEMSPVPVRVGEKNWHVSIVKKKQQNVFPGKKADIKLKVMVPVGEKNWSAVIEIEQQQNASSGEKADIKMTVIVIVPPGEKIWSGVTHAGDHVFVNRVLWNFRKPRRGEVMVFNTGSIKGLPQGTHYIKRLVGLPGETIGVNPPELLVDGRSVAEPSTIGRIVRREAAPNPENGYSNYLGYKLIGDIPPQGAPAPSPLRFPGDTVSLRPDEYLGMGDNPGNSYDGRYWGAVPARNLLGPGAFVYWPFTSKRLGLIH